MEDKYSKPKELTFSVLWGWCSGAYLFTCYFPLIDNQINNYITLNGFTDDHSICKNFKAGNKNQKQQTKTDLEEAFKQIKCCMDTMHLKLNVDKTEYILFWSQAQLKKISPEPLNAHGDLIETAKKWGIWEDFCTNNSISNSTLKKSKKTMTNLIKIYAIQKYFIVQTCTTLILMFCITHLDYVNAIPYGLPKSTLENSKSSGTYMLNSS